MSAQQLINLEQHDDEMRVSSRQLSEGVGVQHKATATLIRKHKKLLETFGYVEFEMSDKSKSGREKHALLNEDQSIFLLTLSKNSEQVVAFKHQLVTEFSKLRRKQALIDEQRALSKWQQDRALGKYQRKGLTAEIKQYIEYAKTQGSEGADHYYNLITRTINKTIGIDNRDEVDENKLHRLATAEEIVAKCLLDGMAACLPYKQIYKTLKIRLDDLREALPVEEAA